MKYQRHSKILELVKNESIETQDQLMARLKESGFDVTQATVSRDVKELRLYKRTDHSGVSRYDVANNNISTDDGNQERFVAVLKHNMRSIDYAGNIVVIKAFPGMAQAVCAAIDAMNFDSVIGSIAGDDTIFLAVRTPDAVKKTISDLNRILQ